MTSEREQDIVQWASEALRIEADAVADLIPRLDGNFARVVDLLAACEGKVVTSGMGKAGIIAQKSSATFSSLGTPSVWLHLAEAVHGDLGRVEDRDVVVILSYSGETDELRTVVPILKIIGSTLVAITGRPNSYLGKYADYVLDVSVPKEVCLDLAPTTSTTAMLALCDAIAVALQKLKGFEAHDFAKFHPKGSLGRKLLFRVEDCMRRGDRNPLVNPQTPVSEALLTITRARAGSCTIVGEDGVLLGIFTDGDLRRYLEKGYEVLNRLIGDVMTRNPIVVHADMLATEAMRTLEERKIDEVPVVDEAQRVVGLLDVQDLLEAGIV